MVLQEVKQAPVIENLSHELQTQIKVCRGTSKFAWCFFICRSVLQSFVSGMDLFLSQLDAKEEIFSLGYFSAMISKELCVLPDAVSRRKVSQRAAASSGWLGRCEELPSSPHRPPGSAVPSCLSIER